jgi:hypothetical protein
VLFLAIYFGAEVIREAIPSRPKAHPSIRAVFLAIVSKSSEDLPLDPLVWACPSSGSWASTHPLCSEPDLQASLHSLRNGMHIFCQAAHRFRDLGSLSSVRWSVFCI